MRSARLVALVALTLAITAVVSPWIARAFAAGGRHFTFARVFDRVFEVLLVAGVVLAWRPLDLGSANAIGFRRDGWGRALGRGLAIGLAGIGAALVVCWIAGTLVPALRFDPAKTVRKAMLGLAGAVLIGAGEEALFRGVLLRRFTKDAGLAAGLVVTTAVYAAVHAIRVHGGPEPVTAWSGFERTAALVAPLAAPGALRTLAGLFAFGLVLALARLRSGSLWLPIGIHAAWVAVFRVGRLFFELGRTPVWLVGPGWPPLVGGVAGWLAIVATALLVARRRRLG